MVHENGGRVLRRALQLAAMLGLALAVILSITMTSRAVGTFVPTITFETSTSRATAHPDARITIDNSQSSEHIKSISLSLPNGFWGSLAAATKCSVTSAQAGTCGDASQIGTVSNGATVDSSDVVLRGKIYLTEDLAGNDDPAGISIVVDPRVGGVSFPKVIVAGRVQARYAAAPAGAPSGSTGVLQGIDTTVNDVPRSVTDLHGRTIEFHLDKLVIDLTSNLSSANPLLTNPSTCSPVPVNASLNSYDSTPAAISDTYTVTGCNTVKFAPSTFNFGFTDPSAGTETGLTSTISFPPNHAAINAITVKLPPFVSLNFPSFGLASDQCPAGTASGNPLTFNPNAGGGCPPQAKVGTATISTPLLDAPVVGNVYLINSGAVPRLGIDVNPSLGANPAGVTIRLVGTNVVDRVDPNCNSTEITCVQQVIVRFQNLPDTPVSSIQLTLNESNRAGSGLSGKILNVATAGDPACQPLDDVTATFSSKSAGASSNQIAPMSISGCTSHSLSTVGPPLGSRTTATTPTLPFSGTSSAFTCAVDSQPPSPLSESCNPPSYSPSAPLGTGIHRFWVLGDGGMNSRGFIVDPPAVATDNTPPVTSLTSPGSSLSTATPDFDFGAPESSNFQCALGLGSDPSKIGAFLPCDSGAASTTGSFAVAQADALIAGETYTFAVRAQDVAGNIDSTPASATFTVDIPFAPTFSADVSTTAARAHPDLDVTITNPSHEDLKDVSISLPDGFMGGLNGVQTLCPVSSAAAGNCGVESQVGTIDTSAIVDESTINISGTVYLTEPLQAGDPAGLSIKVPAKLQQVDLGNIIVPARLKLRGNAQGVDSIVVGVPDRITPPAGNIYGDTVTEFDMRSMTLKLRTGAGASQPLLTNASSCAPGQFRADYAGYGNSTETLTQPYTVTNCDALGFSPVLKASIVDATTGLPPGPSTEFISTSANLTASVTANPDDAGIKDVNILMPKALTINVTKIPKPCEIEQMEADVCPAATRVGSISAVSPLLPEALGGEVYLLRAVGELRTPRLFLRLRGRISLDIIAVNAFVKVNGKETSIIRTIFSNLPDVPLSKFTMNVDKVLSTVNETCNPGTTWNMTGTMTGHNGKTSAVDNALAFDCSGVAYKYKFKPRGNKSSLSFSVLAQGNQPKFKKIRFQLPRTVRLNKRQLKKKLVVRADGKKLKWKCIKVKSATVLETSFCGRKVKKIDFTFRPQSLLANKKLRAAKVMVTTTDISNKRKTNTLNLRSSAFNSFRLPSS
jgi:hypothetical protein